MKRLNIMVAMLCIAFAVNVSAQEEIPFNDLPPNPEDGKCYAKCKIPDQFETVSTQQLVKEGTTKTVVDKPEYETVTERVMIKEGSFKYTYVPATYETVDKQVLVKDGYCITKKVPARYEYKTTGKTLVEPAKGQWVRKKKDPNCFSANPEDCFIMCWETVPAKYQTTSERILVQPESVETIQVDAVYSTIKVQVVKEPARYERVEIPPVYKNVTRRVLKNQGCLEERVITTPAQYKTVSSKRVVSSGGYTGWVEILCAAKTSDNAVTQVQKALNAKGYNVGAADGIMGIKTRAMLVQFQKDNNLPEGNLNIATLKALGLEDLNN